DEILQLVFNELDRPAAFALLSRRYHAFSQDPYTRARYLLARHGHLQAFFYALGKPSIVTERVLSVRPVPRCSLFISLYTVSAQILLTSGAHISRYLVQLAVHHYFRTPVPFIKHPWVKLLPLPVFAHFLNLATTHLGDFSTTKGEDDGSVFCLFVKESRMPAGSRTVNADVIVEMLARYKFMPFCDKDPIMAQFPLALAIEPRFLPLAVANGFRMDSSYRDYVFRRMFERSSATEMHTRKILHNVRELCRLDPSMFVSRTVAAEVCMEAQANPAAYSALKTLDRTHELKFELSALVHDLIKNFVSTRSVSAESSATALQFLYRDFLGCSSPDPTVRLVLLLSVFASTTVALSATSAHVRLQQLKLAPLTRADLVNVLLSPFVEQFSTVGTYASVFMVYSKTEIQDLLNFVAIECLSLSSKGSMLKAIVSCYPEVEDEIAYTIGSHYRVAFDALPVPEDERACTNFYSRLCGDLYTIRKNALVARRAERPTIEAKESAQEPEDGEVPDGIVAEDAVVEAEAVVVAAADQSSALGSIGQLTLAAAIHNDDLNTARRRRYASTYTLSQYPDFASLLPYPADAVHVGRWLATHFGARHPVTAELMKHVVINQPTAICTYYVAQLKVPITLMHFKLLARLGRSPAYIMLSAIEDGAPYYESEADYLIDSNPALKLEPQPKTERLPPVSAGRKRPRRSAAPVRSYVVPGSDDEDGDENMSCVRQAPESEISKWLRHLSALHRDELRQLNERKRRAEPDRVRVGKNDFLRFIGPRLREWRRREDECAQKMAQCVGEAMSEGEDDGGDTEYRAGSARKTRRRRTAAGAV
ncbi:hypothetical protein K488DRAFT_45049, partial [Vararia minispora EC-137]